MSHVCILVTVPASNFARSNCPAQQRQQIAQAIAANLVPAMRDTNSVPFLLSALLDGDETLRSAATNAIWLVSPDLPTNTPPQ